MIAWLALVVTLGACASERARPDAEPSTGMIHPTGILDPDSDAFHGRELARRGWDLGVCATCHGEDFSGGSADVSCNGCHRERPTACVTCHEAGPRSNAHGLHRGAEVACSECHVVPDRWDAEGHIRRDGIADLSPAEVTFGTRAALTLDPMDRAGPPTFSDGRCANVYCHGDALHAGGGASPRPRWDALPIGGCASCHGAPPPSHAQDRCSTCHPSSAPHIDGAVQIGRTTGCDGCHGSAASPAPPTDLAGNQFSTAIGVGAHQPHLDAPSRLRGPIACATCHLVPDHTGAPGHVDSLAPAEVAASVGWDRTAASCASACHGEARPNWTQTGGTSCGSCHGVPPNTASHPPNQSITSCATCHPRTIDSSGTILINSGPLGAVSEHIDGDVDLL